MSSVDRTWDEKAAAPLPDATTLPESAGLAAQLGALPERYDTSTVQVLGQGGLGAVFSVRDTLTGRSVALKVLHRNRTGSRATRSLERRFLREARITAQLQHPGIIPVYEIAKFADGSAYYTMKRVRGRTLETALAEARDLTTRLTMVSDLVQVAHAVAYAHSRGVVHRDLKPANIMVGEFGETLVLDWGIARLTGDLLDPDDGAPQDPKPVAADQTAVGTIMGTPAYMSPEQARGDLDTLDARSDVWSLGIILFQLVSGARPFDGPDVLDAVRHGVAPRLQDVFPAAPPELAAIVARALSADPADRYPTARDLAEDLEAWLGGGAVKSYRYGLGERMGRIYSRIRSVVVTLAVSAAVVAVVSAGFVARQRSQEGATREVLRDAWLREADAAAETRPGDAAAALASALGVRDTPQERARLAELSRRWSPTRAGRDDGAGCTAPAYRGESARCGTESAWPSEITLRDGRTLVALDDGTVSLRGPNGQWAPLRVGTGPGRLVAAGRVVVDVRDDGRVSFIDPAGPEVVGVLPTRARTGGAVALSPNGEELAVVDATGALERWTLPTHGGLASGLFARADAPDELLFLGSDLVALHRAGQLLQVFDAQGDARTAPVVVGPVLSMFAAAEGAAWMTTRVGITRFVAPGTVAAWGTPAPTKGAVWVDAAKVFVASDDGIPVLWNVDEARELLRLDRPWAAVSAAAPSHVVVVESPEGSVMGLDLDTQRLTPLPLTSLAGTARSATRLAAARGSEIVVYSLDDGAEVARVAVDAEVVALALAPDATRVAWTGPRGLQVTAVPSGRVEAWDPLAEPRWLTFDPAGETLWWGGSDRVRAWDLSVLTAPADALTDRFFR